MPNKHISDQQLAASYVLPPEERMRRNVADFSSVEIDANVPPKRYYRSGLEMVRMANVYLEEGQLENAYFLYLKFMTLFLEKIRTHPALNTVSRTDREMNQQKLREVLPKAEGLKNQLLKMYGEEYKRYLRDEEKRHEQAKLKQRPKRTPDHQNIIEISTEPPVLLEPVPPLPNDLNYNLEPSAPAHSSLTRPGALSIPTSNVPGVDRSTKPNSLLSPTLSNSRLGLRMVVVPHILHAKFILLAQNNTDKNVETCGILAGRLDHDRLVISHLVVPKQHGGADHCNMDSEEEICEYLDQRELLTLGWIHTHPTQSAFLSSVDLHTHFSYQLMMPEAIAIVCAPKYQEVKVFCLTPYHGLEFIKNCRQIGFHPHPNEPPLFMVAAHYTMDSSSPLEVVDLRRR